MYSPTHYYVRVSRAETFTVVSLTSYRQTRAPPCATLNHLWADQQPGRHKGGKVDASGALGDHGSSAGGRLFSTSPAEGLPPGGPCSVRCGEGSGSRLLSCCPQRDPPGGREDAELGPPAAVVT